MWERPQTTVILAMTADGKIADKMRSPARFGSAHDKAHLEQQIAKVDATLFGAGTLRAYGTTLPITNPQLQQERQQAHKPKQPYQIVVSASGELDSQLRFFSQAVPRWLLTTQTGAAKWRDKTNLFERILIVPASSTENAIDWPTALQQLKQLNIHKLAILGGGTLVASLLSINCIDEIWLTLCPVIFGGTDAPTSVDGMGWLAAQAKKLTLLSVHTIEQEIFLHYRIRSSPNSLSNL